jgi:hypothetical protein
MRFSNYAFVEKKIVIIEKRKKDETIKFEMVNEAIKKLKMLHNSSKALTLLVCDWDKHNLALCIPLIKLLMKRQKTEEASQIWSFDNTQRKKQRKKKLLSNVRNKILFSTKTTKVKHNKRVFFFYNTKKRKIKKLHCSLVKYL